MIIMNNSLVSKIPIWMKFVGHKKVKKKQQQQQKKKNKDKKNVYRKSLIEKL